MMPSEEVFSAATFLINHCVTSSGISPDTEPKLWELFVRACRESKEVESGS